MTSNDPRVLAHLLRAIARSPDAQDKKHDIIFNAAADILASLPAIFERLQETNREFAEVIGEITT